MTWFAVLVAIFGGGIVYKLTSSGKIYTLQNLEGHHSRIKNNPIGSDVARQAVTDLFRSGHPDEIAMRSNYKSKSLREIQGHTANDLQKNASILASDHFNNAKKKRQTYATVGDSTGFPSLNFATGGWYLKTVEQMKSHKPNYVKTF